MGNRTVSEIFEEVPGTWGLRGDPYFWDSLKQHFKGFPLPYSKEAFIGEVYRFFEKETGEKLTKECKAHIPKYPQEGMSGGFVSGAFWVEHAIPLLLQRLEKANADAGRSVFCCDTKARTSGIIFIVVSSLVLLFIGIVTLVNYTPAALIVFALYLLIYIPILAIGIAQVCLNEGSIHINDECIEYKSRRESRRIYFREIGKVTFAGFSVPYIKLHTRDDSIRISKKIEGYQKLYRILSTKIPQLNATHEGPVILRNSFWGAFGTPAFGVLLFCGLVYFSVNGYTKGSTPLLMALFMGGLGVFSIIYIIISALIRPFQYRLDEEGVTVRSVLKSKFHHKNSIRRIQYGQIKGIYHRYRRYAMVNYIKLKFSDNPDLMIDDRFIKGPIEAAASYAEKTYGITPEYNMIEKY